MERGPVKRGALSRILAVLIVSAPLSTWFYGVESQDRDKIAAHRGEELLQAKQETAQTPVGTYFLIITLLGLTTGAVEGVAWTIRAGLGYVDVRRARDAHAGPLPAADAAHRPPSASSADVHLPTDVIYVPSAGGGAAERVPEVPWISGHTS